MPTFLIKAVKPDGEQYTETVEAEDKLQLYQQIKKRKHTLISAEEKKNRAGSFLSSLRNFSIGGSVKTQEVITATQNLSAMLEAGLSLSKGLSVLQRQTRNSHFQTVLRRVEEGIESGETFGSALEKEKSTFSNLFIAMVKAGEESGNLTNALNTVGLQMEKAEGLKKRIRGAMIYPGIILTVMVVIAILMLTFIVPILTETFEDMGVDLPVTTQAVIMTSDLVMDNPGLMSALVSILILGGFFFLRSQTGRLMLDFTVLHLPVIKEIVKELNAARTARTFSSLLSSGVDAVTALSITRDVVQNSYYKPIIKQAEDNIQKGQQISEVFIEHEHLYPVLVGEMMAVGEETGKMDDMLLKIAEFFESEVDQRTKDMSTIVEPVLMIIIGISVGFFAISMLMPMYSIMEQI